MKKTKSQSNTVGRSSRTPLKHFIFNIQLGRAAGVIGSGNCFVQAPLIVVDVCAGDGERHEGGESSPSIIRRHLCNRSFRGKGRAILIEKNEATFGKLREGFGNIPQIQLIHGDSRCINFDGLSEKKNQGVFIHIDPNSIEDWPVSSNLLANMTSTTTFLATLGCNVGGLKRLGFYTHRVEWYIRLSELIENIPSFHDVHLYVLNRDKAQWAYLLRLPRAWSEETMIQIKRKGDKLWPQGLTCASLKKHPQLFQDLQDQLFLTAEERKIYASFSR